MSSGSLLAFCGSRGPEAPSRQLFAGPSVGEPTPSVALVHDYLLVMRGAERTFAAMADCWPASPLYTLLYDEHATQGRFTGRRVSTSYLQRLRPRQENFRWLLPFFPRAAESLPLGEHDVVVSSSSAFAHGVRPGSGAVHICYCHSPFRYTWHEAQYALQEAPALTRPMLRRTLEAIRRWDIAAAQRVTHYVANSQATRERIRQYYGRDATVIHPPVAVERFHVGRPCDYLLVVGEIVRHKRVDVALEAARRAGRKVRVVGTGPDLDRLRQRYGSNAVFMGRVGDDELARLYAGAQAVVVPGVEEFGIVAVEAQAAGRPVVSVAAGGARETVRDGTTGVLVAPDDVEQLAEALRYVDFERFDTSTIRRHAEGFSTETFARRLRREVSRHAGRHPPPR